MPDQIIPTPDLITLNGRAYIALDVANRMTRDALDAVEPLAEWVSAKEAAQMTRRSLSTIYDAARRGQIEGFVPNGVTRGLRLRRSSVEAWAQLGRPYAKGETDE